MPLHRPEKTMTWHVKGLYQSIRRECHHLKVIGNPSDSLMMVAVHWDPLSSKTTVQRRVPDDHDLVTGYIVWGLLMVLHLGWVLGWEVLIQRTSEICVYELDSPADSKYRPIILKCP